jgi:fucose permease
MSVSAWVVRLLSDTSITTATTTLSIFWLGLALGRFFGRWVAEVVDYGLLAMVCALLGNAALATAVFVHTTALSVPLFGVTGLFYGPVYPMIMSIGGEIYPHRLARLSGGLAAAAVVGTLVYPPIMGVLASSIGLRVALLGASLFGLPSAGGIYVARVLSRGAQGGKPVHVADRASR